ncbi:MAG: hypothetical protein RI956_762, partial [Pseudomonadota bacterium]
FSKFEKSNQFYDYRPFDIRNIEYDLGKVQRHRFPVMKHMLKTNVAIMTCRQLSTFNFQHIFISKYLIDMCTVSLQTKETTYAFPLYLYPDTNGQQSITTPPCGHPSKGGEFNSGEYAGEFNSGESTSIFRTPNLDAEIIKKIAEQLGLRFVNEKQSNSPPLEGCPQGGVVKNNEQAANLSTISQGGDFAPIDLLDYIYAVLHSPAYREKYKEFLKIDFPRVPYLKDSSTFWQLVKLGGELRQIHLLESDAVEDYITQYPIDGENRVSNLRFENNHPAINSTPPKEGNLGKVYINDTQYFDNVPLIAWEFYIGGYQPAQKWLKDRKGRTLEFDDILHYQKMIVALSKTDELMKKINAINIE